MVGGNLVAQSQEHLFATRELLVHLLKIGFIGFHVKLSINVHVVNGDVRNMRCHFPFVLVAKDKIAILHQFMKNRMCISTIFPKVFAVIDVASNGKSHLLCCFYRLKRSICGTLTHRTSYA